MQNMLMAQKPMAERVQLLLLSPTKKGQNDDEPKRVNQ